MTTETSVEPSQRESFSRGASDERAKPRRCEPRNRWDARTREPANSREPREPATLRTPANPANTRTYELPRTPRTRELTNSREPRECANPRTGEPANQRTRC